MEIPLCLNAVGVEMITVPWMISWRRTTLSSLSRRQRYTYILVVGFGVPIKANINRARHRVAAALVLQMMTE